MILPRSTSASACRPIGAGDGSFRRSPTSDAAPSAWRADEHRRHAAQRSRGTRIFPSIDPALRRQAPSSGTPHPRSPAPTRPDPRLLIPSFPTARGRIPPRPDARSVEVWTAVGSSPIRLFGIDHVGLLKRAFAQHPSLGEQHSPHPTDVEASDW